MTLRIAIALSLFVFAGCGTDAVGDPEPDAGGTITDSGSNEVDMAVDEPDMRVEPEDMGTEPVDMAMEMDAAADAEAPDMPGDAGDDAGMADAGMNCDQTGFSVTSSKVETIAADYFVYEAVEGMTSDANYRTIDFSIFPEDGGTIAVQGFTFTGESYADCGLCLLAYACTANGCDTTLMAQSGNVDISAIGTGNGDAFAAEFRDLVFQEVDIDSSTFATTIVPGGLTWCVPTLSASGSNVAN